VGKSLGELGHEGNHEVEKTNGLDESETQNGVGEELATESRVAGNTVEEGSEDETDTDTSTSQTDGGGTHTQVLGDLDHSLSDLRRVGTALDLEGIAGGGVDDGRGLLALKGLHGGSSAQGALGGSDGSTHGRASSLGGHLGGQTGSEDTGGGHCDDVRGDGVWMGKCGKSLVWRMEEDGEISAWGEKKREQSWEERKRLEEESR
jgi:hypothetical protein